MGGSGTFSRGHRVLELLGTYSLRKIEPRAGSQGEARDLRREPIDDPAEIRGPLDKMLGVPRYHLPEKLGTARFNGSLTVYNATAKPVCHVPRSLDILTARSVAREQWLALKGNRVSREYYDGPDNKTSRTDPCALVIACSPRI